MTPPVPPIVPANVALALSPKVSVRAPSETVVPVSPVSMPTVRLPLAAEMSNTEPAFSRLTWPLDTSAPFPPSARVPPVTKVPPV